jgi:repressor LexA
MSEKGLSDRQQQLLDTLRSHVQRTGLVPSIRELGEALGVHSTSTIHYHLKALADHGHIRWDRGKNRAIQIVQREPDAPARGLPLAGRIAAGMPIQAVADDQESVVLDDMWSQQDHYVLMVRGTSMVDDAILPGDLVIVRRQDHARDGEIVVALLDDGEATLKRLFRDNGRFRLQPANATMAPIVVDRVTIQGKVVGVVRQLS